MRRAMRERARLTFGAEGVEGSAVAFAFASRNTRPPQRAGAPSFAFLWRRVGSHDRHAEGAWGFSLTNPGLPVFQEKQATRRSRARILAPPSEKARNALQE
jgi:hypothetical protein